MVFSSFTFLFYFLPALLACYYILPRRLRQGRNLVLLGASLFFYGCAGTEYLKLMCVSIALNYIGGLLVTRDKLRKGALALTVAGNLALLGWFKYADFTVEVLHGLGAAIPLPEITLPVGISFFTFQGMSYVIDTYRDRGVCQKNPLKLALYISLFPQLVAGPIVRYTDIAAEIDAGRENLEDIADGFQRFSFGLAKKMLLANPMAAVADGLFALPLEALSVSGAWVGAIAYALQIYFDFSGYSDMAIGLGKLFGFHFAENFNYPYISRSVTEFWRRWHISLGSWFRDYVYIPLGGNRRGRGKQIRNILIVWTLTGLWHGAGWTFIFWGLWYALLLLAEKLLGLLPREGEPRWLSLFRWLGTMLAVLVGWVFFRAETLGGALGYLKVMAGLGAAGTNQGQGFYYLLEYWPEFLVGLLACLPAKSWLERRVKRDGRLEILGPKILALVLFALSYIALITGSFNPFIYFRF